MHWCLQELDPRHNNPTVECSGFSSVFALAMTLCKLCFRSRLLLPDSCPYLRATREELESQVERRRQRTSTTTYDLTKKFLSITKTNELRLVLLLLAGIWLLRPKCKKPRWVQKHWLKMKELKVPAFQSLNDIHIPEHESEIAPWAFAGQPKNATPKPACSAMLCITTSLSCTSLGKIKFDFF